MRQDISNFRETAQMDIRSLYKNTEGHILVKNNSKIPHSLVQRPFCHLFHPTTASKQLPKSWEIYIFSLWLLDGCQPVSRPM